jgi:hypothetical protein
MSITRGVVVWEISMGQTKQTSNLSSFVHRKCSFFHWFLEQEALYDFQNIGHY